MVIISSNPNLLKSNDLFINNAKKYILSLYHAHTNGSPKKAESWAMVRSVKLC